MFSINGMFLPRFLTTIVITFFLFIPGFIVCYFSACVLIGASVGAQVGVTMQGKPQDEFNEAIQQAVQKTIQADIVYIVIGAFLVSLFFSFMIGLLLSVSGLFSWCRAPQPSATLNRWS